MKKVKLQVNPNLVKTDPLSDVVVDSRTNARYEISRETLELLELFLEPKLADEALSLIDCSSDDRRKIHTFIQELFCEGLLVRLDDKKAESAPGCHGDLPVFETPARGFFSTPVVDKDSMVGADIAFVGVPFDLGTTGYPGTRFAPDRMRTLSSDAFEYHVDVFTGKGKGWWSPETNSLLLQGFSLADVGNVLLRVGEPFDTFFDRVSHATTTLLENGSFPVIVGGDHSITYAAVRSFHHYFRSIKVLHIDAHADMGDLPPGVSNNHGNVFTRIIQENLCDHLIQVGVRGTAAKDGASDALTVLPLVDIKKFGVEKALCTFDSGTYYLTIDIDVLDPSIAPGTGTPVSRGMSSDLLFEFLTAVSKKVKIVGMDLVEVNPMLDHNNQTSELGISLILHTLGAIFGSETA